MPLVRLSGLKPLSVQAHGLPHNRRKNRIHGRLVACYVVVQI
jgi:hypothetical protein